MIPASESMPRSSVKKESRRRGRRLCHHGGCKNPNTHSGMANGVCLMQGCEFHVAMWVRSPADLIRASQRAKAARKSA